MTRGVTIVASVLCSFGLAAADVPVTGCGQLVPSGQVGVLQGDLDCPPAPGSAGACAVGGASCVVDADCPASAPICLHPAAVLLGPAARLRLAGHGVGGADVGVDCRTAATKGCTIEGPGEIRQSRYGLLTGLRGQVRLSTLVVRDNGLGVTDAFGTGTSGTLKLRLEGVTVANGATGGILLQPLAGRVVRGTVVTVTDNGGPGISVGLFVSADPPRKRNSRARITSLVASGNAGLGIYADKLVLIGGTVIGNPIGGGGVDLMSFTRPRLIAGTVCGVSRQLVDGVGGSGTWGVCSDDP